MPRPKVPSMERVSETSQAIVGAFRGAAAWLKGRFDERTHPRLSRWYDIVRCPLYVVAYAALSFVRHRMLVTAAAIAFFSLLSFAPFMFVIGTTSALAVGRSEVGWERVEAYMVEVLPVTQTQARDLVSGLVSTSIPVTGLGFAILLWTAASAFNLTYEAICHAGEVPARFLRRRLVSLGVILMLAALVLAGFLLASAVPLVRAISLSKLSDGPLHGQGLRTAAAAVVLILIYRLSAGRALSWAGATVGGILGAAVWGPAKWLFCYVVVTNFERGTIYGALTTFVMVLLWVHYSACMLLAGAELAFAFDRRKELLAMDDARRRAAAATTTL